MLPPSKFFPDIEEADRNGLLCIGDNLLPEVLVDAYTHGIFPWPMRLRNRKYVTCWFCPDPRSIFDFDTFHVPRRLAQKIRKCKFDITLDKDFESVIRNCAAAHSNKDETWITPILIDAFINLHKLGVTHSVEVREGEKLVGGIYGVAINGFFAGESMFSLQTDASKIALVFLKEHLQKQGFELFDIQVANPHTQQFGAIDIPRSEYLQRLESALRKTAKF
ncbi:MAG: leucyl/phenylalanyl-tRNA--protein transferase [Planctomycetaceae bacterium]|nr:leucyl/phenylalanyl-tRNA--protein transferase [Planctomycetaceae bacterium]